MLKDVALNNIYQLSGSTLPFAAAETAKTSNIVADPNRKVSGTEIQNNAAELTRANEENRMASRICKSKNRKIE
jgi:hypothetical protein